MIILHSPLTMEIAAFKVTKKYSNFVSILPFVSFRTTFFPSAQLLE